MKTAQLAQLLMWAGLAIATPTTWPRAVPSLDAAAFAEAQQRDDTATRAFSNTQIKVCVYQRPSSLVSPGHLNVFFGGGGDWRVNENKEIPKAHHMKNIDFGRKMSICG